MQGGDVQCGRSVRHALFSSPNQITESKSPQNRSRDCYRNHQVSYKDGPDVGEARIDVGCADRQESKWRAKPGNHRREQEYDHEDSEFLSDVDRP